MGTARSPNAPQLNSNLMTPIQPMTCHNTNPTHQKLSPKDAELALALVSSIC
jgi:hypothetical protein